jgi:hypothetical protein
VDVYSQSLTKENLIKYEEKDDVKEVKEISKKTKETMRRRLTRKKNEFVRSEVEILDFDVRTESQYNALSMVKQEVEDL